MRILISILALALWSGVADAQQQLPTPPPPPGTSAPSTLETIGRTVFSAIEKRAIEEFFGHTATPVERILVETAKQVLNPNQSAPTDESAAQDSEDPGEAKEWKKQKKAKGKGKGRGKGKHKGLPPGLAKRGELPPGLQRRAAKHGSLPPGLAKRELPAELEQRLPPPKPGTERIITGSDVVLVDQATNAVLDVLYDVVVGGAR